MAGIAAIEAPLPAIVRFNRTILVHRVVASVTSVRIASKGEYSMKTDRDFYMLKFKNFYLI